MSRMFIKYYLLLNFFSICAVNSVLAMEKNESRSQIVTRKVSAYDQKQRLTEAGRLKAEHAEQEKREKAERESSLKA